jgi:hypothetical protein
MTNLRTLTLTHLLENGNLVDWLVDEAQPLQFERTGPDDAAVAIASLANTIGGWVVIDGDVRLPALVAGISPPPPVRVATPRMGTTVVQVAASADTPHALADGTVPVRDHEGLGMAGGATLRALLERGEAGRADARRRQRTRPLIEEAMHTPDKLPGDAPILDPDSFGHDAPLEFIVRATPVTVAPELPTAVLTEDGARLAGSQAIPLLVDPDAVAHRVATVVEGRINGVYCTAERGGAPVFADLAIDAGGVVAARLAERRQRDGTVTAAGVIDEVLLPLLRTVAGTLEGLEAGGRAFVDLEVRGAADLVVEWEPELSDVVRLDELVDEDRLLVDGELELPAGPADLQELAERWARGLARAAGLPAWEPRPDARGAGGGRRA